MTAGLVDGGITDRMGGREFWYSSLGDGEYLEVIRDAGCRCVLLERAPFPEERVVFIGVKESPPGSAP